MTTEQLYKAALRTLQNAHPAKLEEAVRAVEALIGQWDRGAPQSYTRDEEPATGLPVEES